MEYDAKNDTRAKPEDCEAAVGKRATLPLTGRIVETRTSNNGCFVMFEIDERWGFAPGQKFGLDLEAFEIQED